jgi:hypothetical protein
MLFSLALIFSGIFLLLEIKGVSKYISRFLGITPLVLLFIIVGFNRLNDDYFNYKYMFINDAFRDQVDFGYVYIVKILEHFGQNHETLVFLTGCFLLFTLLKVMKTNRHINLLVFLYCCFPLIYDINQIRNTIMYLIIILSFGFIERKKGIKYYISLFIAFSIHKFALVYLPFYYLCKKNRKQFMKLITILFLIFLFASPIVINLISKMFPGKMEYYLTLQPHFGILIIFAYTIIDVFTVWWIDRRINNKLNEEEKKKMEVLYRFVWFSVLILPFTFYFLEIMRVQRNALLVKYLYCTLAMNHLNIKEKLFIVLLLLISVAMYITVTIYNGNLNLFGYLDDNYIKELLNKYVF